MSKIRNLTVSQVFSLLSSIVLITTLIAASIIYYGLFVNTTDDLVEYQSSEINKQIVLNYEGYIDDVVQTVDYLQYETLKYDVLSEEVKSAIELSSNLERDIVSIIIFDVLGNTLVKSDNKDVVENISFKSWFQNAINEKEIFHFSSVHFQDVYIESDEQVITVTKAFEYMIDDQKRTGIMLVDLNFEKIAELSQKTNLGDDGHILIIDEYDELIYSSIYECRYTDCETLSLVKAQVLGEVNGQINGKDMLINVNTLSNTRWRLATVLNVEVIDTTRASVIQNIVLLIMFSLLTTSIISTVISRRVSNPLLELAELMESIEEKDFHKEVEVVGQREVVQLAESFNEMIHKIRELMDRVVFEQKAKRRNELLILQNQINPHFLYNALDSIVWLAENNKNDEVIQTVIALSKLFRISLSKGRNFITLEEEISHVENYLKVQHIRYRNRFEYEIKMDDTVKHFEVLKLIVQPLAENAIYHGIGGLEGQEIINIDCYVEGEFVYIEVTNTGYGMTDDQITEVYKNMRNNESNSGVGMRNIYQRLKIYYGENADVIISSELDEYTKVQLKIPKKESK